MVAVEIEDGQWRQTRFVGADLTLDCIDGADFTDACIYRAKLVRSYWNEVLGLGSVCSCLADLEGSTGFPDPN